MPPTSPAVTSSPDARRLSGLVDSGAGTKHRGLRLRARLNGGCWAVPGDRDLARTVTRPRWSECLKIADGAFDELPQPPRPRPGRRSLRFEKSRLRLPWNLGFVRSSLSKTLDELRQRLLLHGRGKEQGAKELLAARLGTCSVGALDKTI